MNIQEILTKKRHGKYLNKNEIQNFINSACEGTADNSQIGAMLMAIAIKKLTIDETISLTKAIIDSGRKLEWEGAVVDKHSTGGVGDKVSIPLAPALAACGLTVPMMSGRGLGLTGGTLDKLESIHGFKVNLNTNEMKRCLEKANCFICSATSDLCPGDKVLYSIRDVTSTVDCIELIVASILSKKIAEGAKYLVLDIKAGSAALYKTVEEANELAVQMIAAAKVLGIKIKCVITRMDEPIGRTIGNSLEIEESIATLHGEGPADLVELVTYLGGELLTMIGKAESLEEGKQKILQVLNDGQALNRFKEMCISQGVKPDYVELLTNFKFDETFKKAKFIEEFKSKQSGWIKCIHGLNIAKVCWQLGSGRKTPSDKPDLSVGVKLKLVAGDKILENDVWLELHHNERNLTEEIYREIDNALVITSTEFIVPSRIIEVVE